MLWSVVEWSRVRWSLVGSGRVESRGVELSGAKWSRFKSIQIESSHGVELSRVESTVYSRL